MAFRGRYRAPSPLWGALKDRWGGYQNAIKLLNDGANSMESLDGRTPMQYFAENKDIAKKELFDALLRNGAVVDDTCLYRACHNQNVNAVRILLDAKRSGLTHFNVNIVHPERHDTPLFLAVLNKNPAICDLLLKDPDVDPNIIVRDEYTALYYAASENLFDMVDLLLQNPRINPNIPFEGKTPLHVATMNNHIRVVRMLSAHPAIDLYARDQFEATALDLAKARRIPNPDMIALLPQAPLPEPPLTTPLVVHNYEAMPSAMDFDELEERPLNEFDQNYVVFKIGDSFFGLPKETIRKNIEDKDGDRILFECREQLHGAPHVHQVYINQKYFVLSGIGNYVIPLEHILGALVHPTNIFEITGPIRQLANGSSYSAVIIQGERGFKHRRVNIVSRDHCQAGTDKQLYHLHPVRIDIAAAVPAPPAAANARRGGARRRQNSTQRRRINRRHRSAKRNRQL